MLHPVLKVAIKRPALIINHLANYLDLFRQESMGVMSNAVRKAIALAVVAAGLCLFLVFSGVAVMLGVMQGQFHWVLVVVPLAPLLMALIALKISTKPVIGNEIEEIRQQFKADLEMLYPAGDHHAR